MSNLRNSGSGAVVALLSVALLATAAACGSDPPSRVSLFAVPGGPHPPADFYELPRNQDRLTLRKAAWEVPQELAFGTDRLVPMGAGEVLRWNLV